jgi:hypothetical protein
MSAADDHLNKLLSRSKELEAAGLDSSHAFGIASLERRVEQWPPAWGHDLVILIYGDFRQPDETLHYDALGITVHPEKVENTFVRNAMMVLKANVKVSDKSVASVLDAIQRINILLGSWSLLNWSNSGIDFWCFITHGGGGGGWEPLGHQQLSLVTKAVLAVHPKVRRRILAALYWIRAPRKMLLEERTDTLQFFAGYWNAFECLVDAVGILRPRPKESKEDRQRGLDAYLLSYGGVLTLEHLRLAYKQFVDPGFVAKASYALRLCFKDSEEYVDACFKVSPKENQLYSIRNSINHGEIDATNIKELIRVESKQITLSKIVIGMFSCVLPTREIAAQEATAGGG